MTESESKNALQIRIVGRSNGVGIDRDAAIIGRCADDLQMTSTFSPYRSISPLQGIFAAPDSNAILFLERVTLRWMRAAKRYALIPNQERYPSRLIGRLKRVNTVLCKSRHATEIFSRYHDDVRYLGFTSLDRRLASVEPDYTRFFHLAGGSSVKGTEVLLALWGAHPEWPQLTIVRHRKAPLKSAVPDNVFLIRDYLSDEELRRLQNECGVHLCPSLSEGWGHSIVEAMSCASVVVTTDGPPMNELVTRDRGVVVPYERTEPRKLGHNFFIDTAQLEQAVQRLTVAPSSEVQRLGKNARTWFERNDIEFRQRLSDYLRELSR